MSLAETTQRSRVLKMRDASMDSARTDLGAEELAALDPELADFLAIWDERRAGRDIPCRADFLPEDFRSHLGYINVVEPGPGDSYRYRLVGTAIAQAVGRDVTGLTLEQIYSGRAAGSGRRILDLASGQRRPVYCDGTLEASGKDWLGFRMLVVPMDGPDGRVVRLFARMSFPNLG